MVQKAYNDSNIELQRVLFNLKLGILVLLLYHSVFITTRFFYKKKNENLQDFGIATHQINDKEFYNPSVFVMKKEITRTRLFSVIQMDT